MRKNLTKIAMGIITGIALTLTITPTHTDTRLPNCETTTHTTCIQVEDVDAQGNGWGYLVSETGEPLAPVNFWQDGEIELY